MVLSSEIRLSIIERLSHHQFHDLFFLMLEILFYQYLLILLLIILLHFAFVTLNL